MNISKLRGKMAEAGISQRKLSKLTGIKLNTLNTRFTGKRDFSVEEVAAICKVLNITAPNDIAAIFFPDCLNNETK